MARSRALEASRRLVRERIRPDDQVAVAFFSALACVHWLIRYVASHDFVPFAWYRIAFGGLVLASAWSGVVRWH